MTDAAPGPYLSFDAVAGEYDRTRVIPPAVIADIARLCASAARLERGGWFLDAGVGTGRFAEPLCRDYPGQVVGADISLPMMRQAQAKADPAGGLTLVQADLQRLPFRAGTFCGALAVHVLHLIERWPLVLAELRRALVPRTGVLLLGTEQGGHSSLVDYYYAQARRQGVLKPKLGAPDMSHTLAYLRRDGAQAEALSAPYLTWTRRVTVGETLDALTRRTYSQIWGIPDNAHRALLADTLAFARRTIGDGPAPETFTMRFVLHAVRWP